MTTKNYQVDSNTSVITDVTDPATNAQFAGDLASDDFFAIEKYPVVTRQRSSPGASLIQNGKPCHT